MNAITISSNTPSSSANPAAEPPPYIPRACPSSPGYWVRVENRQSLDFDIGGLDDVAPTTHVSVQLNTWR